MEKIFQKKTTIITVIFIVIIVFTGAYVLNIFNSSPADNIKPVSEKAKLLIPSREIILADEVNFSGKNGKNALEVTKATVSIEQDNSGMIISINGRKADVKNREFWALYINDKLAQVGPADYNSKNTDKIHWKIEKY